MRKHFVRLLPGRFWQPVWPRVQGLRERGWATEELLVLRGGRATEAEAEAGPIIPADTNTAMIMLRLFFEGMNTAAALHVRRVQ